MELPILEKLYLTPLIYGFLLDFDLQNRYHRTIQIQTSAVDAGLLSTTIHPQSALQILGGVA